MAANNFDTYDQVRQAEDVQDMIYNVAPVDNPVASMSRTIRATGKLHEWTEDVLKAAKKNARVEGADAGPDVSQQLSELNNFCQIMDEVARIAGTLEEVDKYGRDSEMAYQLELRYGEMANDEETAIIGAPSADGGTTAARQTAVAGTSAIAREMACFQVQMANGRNGASLVIDGTGWTTVSQFETGILQGHQQSYIKGGTPNYLVIPPELALFISDFTRSSGRERDFGNERMIVNVVDLYVSPYGSLDVVLDRHAEAVANGTGAVNIAAGIDFMYSATPVLRATRDYPIAKLGDAENRQVIRESTYAVLNTDAHFLVENIPAALTV